MDYALMAALLGHDQRRIRLWGIVLGVAMLCVFALDVAGQLDISQTLYHRIQWNPFASIIGGLIFGYGMALSGNGGCHCHCHFRFFYIERTVGTSARFSVSNRCY